jgi:alkyl sulfatase BDS1-like metallo-beta-lactamase superfamily hydrolase
MSADRNPALGALIRAGEGQTEAIGLNDFVFMSQDVSNSYLVTTSGDSVLVNAGLASSAARHRRLFAAVSRAPIAFAVATQSHGDHFGGLESLLSPGTRIVVQRDFERNHLDRARLNAFFQPRLDKLWGHIVNVSLSADIGLKFVPDLLVDDSVSFTVGGRRFEVLATPGGETTDSLCVWLPDERIVFTGNLFGPIFLHVPNLATVRGDKQRLAMEYVRSLDRVAALGAHMLITGHGQPIVGAQQIADSLARMRAAAVYVHDATLDGMNAGKDIHTLMREIRLPEAISLGQGHGKVAWNVRAIWEEYAGWFHYDSTTSLYGVPRSSVHADLVDLAGGISSLAERAQRHIAQGRPLEALHLMDIALTVQSDDRSCQDVKAAALAFLLERSGSENLSETMWLRSELAAAQPAQTR